LVRAAVELYASAGSDVPLERIADRAEVGRATLYRNFPDRAALSAAVLEQYLDHFASEVALWEDRADAFFMGIRTLAHRSIASSGFEKIGPMERQAPSINERFRHAVERTLTAPLARAKAARLIRADFEISDVHMLVLMVAGGALAIPGGTINLNIEHALQTLMRGLAASPAKLGG
jgi:AcrR family transcriptional regulator